MTVTPAMLAKHNVTMYDHKKTETENSQDKIENEIVTLLGANF